MPCEAIFQETYPSPATCWGAVWRHSPEYIMPRHFHGQLELLIVPKGWIRERIGSRSHSACARQLIWHLPTVPHEMVERSGEDCDCTFDDDWPNEDQTERLSRLLSNAWLATWCNRHCAQAHTLVELGCALMLEDGSVSRAELCRALDVSEGYLSRRFAAELGISFVEQRARARLARFSALTSGAQRTVLRAGFEAGFGSYEQLFRTFQHFTGRGPRDYLQGGRARIASVTRRDLGSCL